MYAHKLSTDGLRDLDHSLVDMMHRFHTVNLGIGDMGITVVFEFATSSFSEQPYGNIEEMARDRYLEIASEFDIHVDPDTISVEESGFFVNVTAHYTKRF